jgi:hypothetical protein
MNHAFAVAILWALELGWLEKDIGLAAGERFYDVLTIDEIDIVVEVATQCLERELLGSKAGG